jgi:hypothetical protein
MLHERTKAYILGLSDIDLLAYVMTGERVYEPEAIAFAREELDRRKLAPDQVAHLSAPIIAGLARYDVHAPPNPLKPKPPAAVVCLSCGFEAPVSYVEYNWNIGAMVVRLYGTYQGNFCKNCNNKFFWKCFATTFILGWWGVVAFFVSFAVLFSNFVTFIKSRSLEPVPHGARKPVADEAVAQRLVPHLDSIMDQLNQGTPAAEVALAIAPSSGLTPGQVWAFIQTMVTKGNRPIAPNFSIQSVGL